MEPRPFGHIYIGTAVYLQAFPRFLSTIRSKEFQGQMHYIYVPMASDYFQLCSRISCLEWPQQLTLSWIHRRNTLLQLLRQVRLKSMHPPLAI